MKAVLDFFVGARLLLLIVGISASVFAYLFAVLLAAVSLEMTWFGDFLRSLLSGEYKKAFGMRRFMNLLEYYSDWVLLALVQKVLIMLSFALIPAAVAFGFQFSVMGPWYLWTVYLIGYFGMAIIVIPYLFDPAVEHWIEELTGLLDIGKGNPLKSTQHTQRASAFIRICAVHFWGKLLRTSLFVGSLISFSALVFSIPGVL